MKTENRQEKIGNMQRVIAKCWILLVVMVAPQSGFCEEIPGQVLGGYVEGFGLSHVYRLADNQVKLYSQSWATGIEADEWIAYLDDSEALLDSDRLSYYETVTSPIDARFGVEHSVTKTISTTGFGWYKKTASHRFYNNFWGTKVIGETTAVKLIEQPTVWRSEPGPFYLGGVTESGTKKSYVTMYSDPKGAGSTPHWFFVGGSSSFGSLSCSDCANPVYTATQKSTGCNHYNVQIRVSYGRLESETFWIFNNAPDHLDSFGTYDRYLDAPDVGWVTRQRYKVMDMCNGYIDWVNVNENFGSRMAVYQGGTTNWPLSWADGYWTGRSSSCDDNHNGQFNCYAEFDDIMFEKDQSGKVPAPMTTGSNGRAEGADAKVTCHEQTFRAGYVTPGAGTVVKTGFKQYHYLDHGAHKSGGCP